eukprot:jgi/Chlat1/7065/Chrsp56S06714
MVLWRRCLPEAYRLDDGGEEERYLAALANFLRRYQWLYRLHVVDFFRERQWEQLDPSWADAMRAMSMDEQLHMPSGFTQPHWPESLNALLQEAQDLSIIKQPMQDGSEWWAAKPQSLSTVASRGMSPKKQHEVSMMAVLAANVARKAHTTTVVDIGAGQGYLSQVLAFEHNLRVTAIDSNDHHASSASVRHAAMNKHYVKKKVEGEGEERVEAPVMVTGHVGGGEDRCWGDEGVVLVGLHACGDLSPAMLRMFVQSEGVRAVVNVGCCYNSIREATNDTDADDSRDNKEAQHGFPMSTACRELGVELGGQAGMLACQSADRWSRESPQAAALRFRHHAFRAALELVLAELPADERLNHAPLRDFKKKKHRHKQQSDGAAGPSANINAAEEFVLYAREALRALAPTCSVRDEKLTGVWHTVAPYEALVGPFWSLRTVLAPPLESLILLDRLMYLREQHGSNIEAMLVPLFDPAVSPRNVAVVAWREWG